MIETNYVSGLYRARVEDVKDPLKLGRVKARVPVFHGIPDVTTTYMTVNDLPWSSPCFPNGGGYDHGTFILPEVGDYVFLAFEAGNRDKSVYIGSTYGVGSTTSKVLGSMDEDSYSKTYTGSNGQWKVPVGANEVPLEIQEGDVQVTCKIVYKSPKGATIMIEEADEEESLIIVDRGGQIIKMDCPISSSSNSNNNERRRTTRVDKNDLTDELVGKGTITIQNNSGVEIILQGSDISIRNCKNATIIAEDTITLDSDVKVTRNLTVDGKVHAKGSISTDGSVKDAGGNTNHHKH